MLPYPQRPSRQKSLLLFELALTLPESITTKSLHCSQGRNNSERRAKKNVDLREILHGPNVTQCCTEEISSPPLTLFHRKYGAAGSGPRPTQPPEWCSAFLLNQLHPSVQCGKLSWAGDDVWARAQPCLDSTAGSWLSWDVT